MRHERRSARSIEGTGGMCARAHITCARWHTRAAQLPSIPVPTSRPQLHRRPGLVNKPPWRGTAALLATWRGANCRPRREPERAPYVRQPRGLATDRGRYLLPARLIPGISHSMRSSSTRWHPTIGALARTRPATGRRVAPVARFTTPPPKHRVCLGHRCAVPFEAHSGQAARCGRGCSGGEFSPPRHK